MSEPEPAAFHEMDHRGTILWVSFDLYVWYEPDPITADEASAKLDRWDDGEPGVFQAHPRVDAVYTALLDRFPPLESLSDEDVDTHGVWSVTPEPPSESVLAISCVWSRADEVGTAVMELAAEHGLICYEPGFHVVNPNAPGFLAPFVLTGAAVPAIPDPDGRRLDWAVKRLSTKDFFVVLDRAAGGYAQVGYGAGAGAAPGTYALEIREGPADAHLRTETTGCPGSWEVASRSRHMVRSYRS